MLVETESGKKVRIERALRSLVHERDIDEWAYKVEDYIIWTHDDEKGDVKQLYLRLQPATSKVMG